VMEALDLTSRAAAADLIITGEGRFDEQSLRGKAPAGVLRVARECSVPAIVVCGESEPLPTAVDVPVRSLVERFGRSAALEDARGCLIRLVESCAETLEDVMEGSG
jgi:glycerate 2-kinase